MEQNFRDWNIVRGLADAQQFLEEHERLELERVQRERERYVI